MEPVRENENVSANEDSDDYDADGRGENQIPSRLTGFHKKASPLFVQVQTSARTPVYSDKSFPLGTHRSGLVRNVFAGGVQTLIAPYEKISVRGNAGTYDAMLAALSLGTVLGSIVVGKIEARKYVGKLLFVGVLRAGGSVGLISLTTVELYSVLLTQLIGVSLAFANLPLQVLVQARVPGHLLGRVFTSLGALVTMATPIAAVTTGQYCKFSPDRSYPTAIRSSHGNCNRWGIFCLPRSEGG